VGIGDIDETPPNPRAYNAPNPFTHTTRIHYTVGVASRITVDIYDVSGRRIRRLEDRTAAPGAHSVLWNRTADSGKRVARGVYWYAIRGLGEERVVNKMVVR